MTGPDQLSHLPPKSQTLFVLKLSPSEKCFALCSFSLLFKPFKWVLATSFLDAFSGEPAKTLKQNGRPGISTPERFRKQTGIRKAGSPVETMSREGQVGREKPGEKYLADIMIL